LKEKIFKNWLFCFIQFYLIPFLFICSPAVNINYLGGFQAMKPLTLVVNRVTKWKALALTSLRRFQSLPFFVRYIVELEHRCWISFPLYHLWRSIIQFYLNKTFKKLVSILSLWKFQLRKKSKVFLRTMGKNQIKGI
jgi:hypothetical protein